MPNTIRYYLKGSLAQTGPAARIASSLAGWLGLAWLALGCTARPASLPTQSAFQATFPPTAFSGLTLEQLKNATFTFAEAPGGSISLAGGEAQVPLAPDSASHFKAILLSPMAFGDLDSTSGEDAASIVVLDPGGSGSFYYLAAMLNQDGVPVHAASALLGDRIKIKTVSMADGVISVTYLARKPDEPFTTEPSQVIIKEFRLEDGQLVEVSQ